MRELQKELTEKKEQIQNLVLRQKGQGKGQDFEKPNWNGTFIGSDFGLPLVITPGTLGSTFGSMGTTIMPP
ncbi:12158_t:CDS:2 [Ambispora leptoticha]|uniref:12158_t:CDS:1 n=1 Tax=Ambispora leptoticha TaxID=144679 RepID=A0A9N9CNK4_9GLOM|nr:12158_t:CDS:2 [Ambispora leptoticha]